MNLERLQHIVQIVANIHFVFSFRSLNILYFFRCLTTVNELPIPIHYRNPPETTLLLFMSICPGVLVFVASR